MKKLVTNIISWSLAVVITISTSGFMVFVHHCHHHQETFASVFVNFNDHEHRACHDIPRGCCDHGADVPITLCDADGCCQEEVFLLKISPDTEPAKTFNVKLQAPEFPVSAGNEPQFSTQEELQSGKIRKPPPEKPPQSGRSIVILHQQIKADPLC
ncbi:MAG: hypothetical protein R6V49_01005 [Bacteroidales bacterium]